VIALRPGFSFGCHVVLLSGSLGSARQATVKLQFGWAFVAMENCPMAWVRKKRHFLKKNATKQKNKK